MQEKEVKYFSAISMNDRIKFIKLLFRWHGSVWKLLWVDFLWFVSLYVAVTLLYRLYLIKDPENKRIFEATVVYMNKAAEIVPLSFLLGFFVSTVLGRWWPIINSIPWMTKPAFTCQALIFSDHEGVTQQNIRLTVTRYMNLAWILSIINISTKIKKRFVVTLSESNEDSVIPISLNFRKTTNISTRMKMEKLNSDKIIQKTFGKLILEDEIAVFENLEKNCKKPSYLIPLMWATKLLERSLKAGYLKSDSTYTNLINMIQAFENNLSTLYVYKQFSVPLVYTQVIIIVVYTFLISEIFSQQTITSTTRNVIEVYIPVFGIFKFLIYMGWFKVGLCFINPFGDDPTDLPLDEILDYNLEVSSSITPCNNNYFPIYLAESFDRDRFDVLNNFCTFQNDDKIQNKEDDQSNTNIVMVSKSNGFKDG